MEFKSIGNCRNGHSSAPSGNRAVLRLFALENDLALLVMNDGPEFD
jgi:hypothetical protein